MCGAHVWRRETATAASSSVASTGSRNPDLSWGEGRYSLSKFTVLGISTMLSSMLTCAVLANWYTFPRGPMASRK